MDSGMVILLLVLGGVMVYMVFSPTSLIGPWLDRHCKKEREEWSSEDAGETLIHQDDTGVPHITSPKPKGKKRKYKKRGKKK